MSTASSPNDPTPPVLVFLLRAGGVMLLLAFGAVVMPTDTMAAIHRWLGLGELPRAPIVEYLTRSISAFYGFHGGLLLMVTGDPTRYRPIVVYLGWMNVVFGVLLTAIDTAAGLPAWWSLVEGPSVVALGIALLVLVRRVPRA